METQPKVILITPAYNEQETIHIIVKSALELVAKGVISEFVVIDDGSTDITAKIARELGATVISLPENRGKGAAFLEGALYCKKAEADILITIDADLVKPLEARIISRMIDEISSENLNMAVFPINEGGGYGDCYLSGQRAIRMPALNFLFDGKNGELHFDSSKAAKRFRKMCRGYGLEIALDYQLKRKKRVPDIELCMDFKEAHRDNTQKMQHSDIDKTSNCISFRQMELELIKRMRAASWHREGLAKRLASKAVHRLVRIMP